MSAFVVAMALCYVLIKIPFWILGSVKISQGRSVLGSMAKAFVAYKTAGLVGAGAKKALGAVSARRVPHPSGRGWTRNDPYEQTSWEADGQGVLPLPGVGGPTSWGPRARRAQAAGSQEQPSGRRGDAAGSVPARPGRHQLAMVTRHGTVKHLPPERRVEPHPGVPRRARRGEQTMMRVFAGYEPQRAPRESVHEAMSTPRPESPQPPESQQPAMVTPDGRIRSHARPVKPRPGAVPRSCRGEQMALNMPLRLSDEQAARRAEYLAQPAPPEQPDVASPASPSQWPRVQGQQSLLRRDGSVHPRARARISPQVRQRARQQHRRRARSAPAAPEFLPPQPPRARTRRGRTAPAPETPTGSDPSARRTRSTRLNTPSAGNNSTRRRRKETQDE